MTLMARLRRLWLDVHLWIGAGLLVALIPLSISGSILVWHDQLDRALHAQRYEISGPAASRPVVDYAQAAQAAFGPRARLTQVRLPQKPSDPVVAVGRLVGPPGPGGRPRTLNAWIDPPTGRVLDTAEVAREFSMVTHRLHGSLLIPPSGGPGPALGRQVVGWLGWAMFVSCATGLWLWWPRHGGFLKGLRWRRGASTLFNLHHLVGFWICIPLAVLSLTGVYISFPQTSRALFGLPPARAGGPGRFAPPIPQPKLTLGQAVAVAQAQAPGAQVTEVNVPTRGNAPAWRISLKTREGAAKTVQVVDATGKAKAPGRGEREGQGGGPDPFSRLVRQVHDGSDMGIVWQTIIFLGGLAPALLGVTGLVMWMRRRARRRSIQHGVEAGT